MILTASEQAEYDRQQKELADPHFHDEPKCGKALLVTLIFKRHTKLNRLYCEVHHIVVNMSGWEIGWSLEGKLSDL